MREVNAAIIVAAGKGTRMGAGPDKLFLQVCGKPVIAHTWSRFDRNSSIDEIVIVVREGQENAFKQVAKVAAHKKPHRIVIGGAERQDSVWNGLEAISTGVQLVAIQDGARPCTADGLITATLHAASKHGAAVAAQRLSDTVKESTDGQFIARHLERSRLWAVQTPQSFRVEVIRRALSAVRERKLHVTDDTAACELIGQPVALVESIEANPKITVPADVAFIEVLLKGSPT